jgi:uncharacterized membrane protein
MAVFILILATCVLLTASYFIIKDGNGQLDDFFKNEQEEIDDPTITCWDDEKNHTEGGFH